MGLAALSKLAPSVAARIATRMWFTPSLWSSPARLRVPDGAEPVSYAWRETTIDGYAIGDGPRKALLVHGWAGSSHQYQRLAIHLAETGFTAVAVDLPGHGLHAGRQTDVYEIADAIAAVGSTLGPLDLVVAHSLGVVPTTIALQGSFEADRYVTVAPGAAPRHAFETFVSMLRISSRVASRVESRIDRRVGAGSLDRITEEMFAAAVPDPTLIVQDTDDEMVTVEDARRLADGWDVPILMTSGYGHNRVLGAPELLDAIAQVVRVNPENADRITADI